VESEVQKEVFLKSSWNPTAARIRPNNRRSVSPSRREAVFIPSQAPRRPKGTVTKTAYRSIRRFFRWMKIAVSAMGRKKIRFIPCALSCSTLAKTIRYSRKTPPPPIPRAPAAPERTETMRGRKNAENNRKPPNNKV